MRSREIVAVGTIVLLAGCAQTRYVNTTTPESVAESRVNRVANNRLARVQLADGPDAYAMDVEVGTDTTSWWHPTTGEIIEMPTSRIESVTVVRAGQGALTGLAAGVVLGGTFGLVRAAVEGDDPVDEFPSVSGRKKLFLYPPAHALYTSIGTTAIGAIVGRKIRFRLVHTDDAAVPPQIAQKKGTR